MMKLKMKNNSDGGGDDDVGVVRSWVGHQKTWNM